MTEHLGYGDLEEDALLAPGSPCCPLFIVTLPVLSLIPTVICVHCAKREKFRMIEIIQDTLPILLPCRGNRC